MTYQKQLLDGINIFCQVVNSASFTAAAQASGYSTSFISKEITKLETRLGVRLLNRTTRSLSLTTEGEQYFAQCQQIVLDAEQAEQLLSGQQVEPQGILKISCSSNLANGVLKDSFKQFFIRYPKVQIDLDLSGRKVDVISEGFDLVIRATGQLEDSSLISRKLFDSYSMTIASKNYLKKFGTPKHPRELDRHKLISYSLLKQPDLWRYEKNGEVTQAQGQLIMTTNSSEMELSMCLADVGITRLPRFNLDDQLNTGELVELFADFDKPAIGVYCIYPSRKQLSTKVRSFIDLLSSNFDSGFQQ